MTSLPGAGLARRQLPAVDHRHHGHGRGGGPGAARSTMTSLPGAGLARRQLPAVDRRHHGHGRGDRGTCEPWGPWEPRHDDQLPGAGLAGVSFPPSIIGTTGTAAGNVARASRGDRGNRGTMTSFPASAFRLSIDGHGGTCEPWGPWHDDQLARRWPCPPSASRRRSSAPRGPRHVRAVARCQVNDDQLARRWPCPPSASRRRSSADWPASIVGTTGTAAGEAPALPGER